MIYTYDIVWFHTGELIASINAEEDAYDYGDLIPLWGKTYEVVTIGLRGRTYTIGVQYAE